MLYYVLFLILGNMLYGVHAQEGETKEEVQVNYSGYDVFTNEEKTVTVVYESDVTKLENSLRRKQFLVKKAIQQTRTIDRFVAMETFSGYSNNPTNVQRVERLLPMTKFDELFPLKDPNYNYDNFLVAVAFWPLFCGDNNSPLVDDDRRCLQSLAIVLAHMAFNTNFNDSEVGIPTWQQGLYHTKEWGWTEQSVDGYNSNCEDEDRVYDCMYIPGEMDHISYFGRGAAMLKWNTAYGDLSQVVYGNSDTLLQTPAHVTDTWLSFGSMIWLFMTPQVGQPSPMHMISNNWMANEADMLANISKGFGMTTLMLYPEECGEESEKTENQKLRAEFYAEFAREIGYNFSETEVTECTLMKPFPEDGEAAVNMKLFYDKHPDAFRPYRCGLVPHQTPYSVLDLGAFKKCVLEVVNISVAPGDKPPDYAVGRFGLTHLTPQYGEIISTIPGRCGEGIGRCDASENCDLKYCSSYGYCQNDPTLRGEVIAFDAREKCADEMTDEEKAALEGKPVDEPIQATKEEPSEEEEEEEEESKEEEDPDEGIDGMTFGGKGDLLPAPDEDDAGTGDQNGETSAQNREQIILQNEEKGEGGDMEDIVLFDSKITVIEILLILVCAFGIIIGTATYCVIKHYINKRRNRKMFGQVAPITERDTYSNDASAIAYKNGLWGGVQGQRHDTFGDMSTSAGLSMMDPRWGVSNAWETQSSPGMMSPWHGLHSRPGSPHNPNNNLNQFTVQPDGKEGFYDESGEYWQKKDAAKPDEGDTIIIFEPDKMRKSGKKKKGGKRKTKLR